MKRSPALQPLSRDHHQALFAALRLRRATPADAKGAVEHFLEFWAEHGRLHFQIEEELLLPGFVRGGGDPHDPLIAKVLTDHVEIRADAHRLSADSPLDVLHELGERLAEHVRLEEDEVFPLIKRTLDAGVLATLGAKMERAESAPTPTP